MSEGFALGRPGSLRLTATLAVGIGAVSCGSIFIRLASAPTLAAAAYRVFWATVLLAPLVAARHLPELALLSRQEWRKLILSGAALALHFALWIASLSYTSVASSVLLVDTTPFFIGLASRWVFGKAPRRVFWFGLAVAFAGCTLVFQEDRSVSSDSMRGNLMAIGGAIAMAIYFLAGATARQKLSLLVYVWPVYASATVFLLLASSVSKTPLAGYPRSSYLFLFLLGLVPQSIGHTSYNWSLRWLSPALVALISLGEPVGASLLAYVILGERVSLMKLFGGAVILLGIYVAARSET
ncbi:MAG: EamA family transporter [Acidobacteria bacterium]|nr:MAG: EamA family transporter [Acidobacteriota bacterium]PYV42502.1 MAG: EamA family transporter [Acidobacteriota bacterium]